MMRFRMISFALFVAGMGCLSPSRSQAGSVTMTFEGLSNNEHVGNYYDGGGGPNYGVSYSSNALALTHGSYSNEPSAPTILYWGSGATSTMEVSGGFETGLSFYYASTQSLVVDIYSGLDGTGTLLASKTEAATPTPYHVWDQVNVPFSGTAESVVFGGAANYCGLDNVTLDSVSAAVPEPSSLVLAGLAAIGGLGVWARRRHRASRA